MQTTQAISLAPDVRVAVAIDLIGDLDATLGVIFSDTLSGLVDAGATDVVLMTKHVALSSEEGINAIDVALGNARAKGCSIVIEPGSRRMKAAFAAARVAVDRGERVPRKSGRHLMIARHASQTKPSHSA
jgi:anti-anti-sigma regulatory factor